METSFSSKTLTSFFKEYTGDISALRKENQRFFLQRMNDRYSFETWANSELLPLELVKELRSVRKDDPLLSSLSKHLDFEDILELARDRKFRDLIRFLPHGTGLFAGRQAPALPTVCGVRIVDGTLFSDSSERIPLTSEQMVMLFKTLREAQGGNLFKRDLALLDGAKSLFSIFPETELLFIKHVSIEGLAKISWKLEDEFREAVLARLRALSPPSEPLGLDIGQATPLSWGLWSHFMKTYPRAACRPKDIRMLKERYAPMLPERPLMLLDWWTDPTKVAVTAAEKHMVVSVGREKERADKQLKMLSSRLERSHLISHRDHQLFKVVRTEGSFEDIFKALGCPVDIDQLSPTQLLKIDQLSSSQPTRVKDTLSYLSSLFEKNDPPEISANKMVWLLRWVDLSLRPISPDCIELLVPLFRSLDLREIIDNFPPLATMLENLLLKSSMKIEEISFLAAQRFFKCPSRTPELLELLLESSNQDFSALDTLIDGFTDSLATLLVVISELGPDSPGLALQ